MIFSEINIVCATCDKMPDIFKINLFKKRKIDELDERWIEFSEEILRWRQELENERALRRQVTQARELAERRAEDAERRLEDERALRHQSTRARELTERPAEDAERRLEDERALRRQASRASELSERRAEDHRAAHKLIEQEILKFQADAAIRFQLQNLRRGGNQSETTAEEELELIDEFISEQENVNVD